MAWPATQASEPNLVQMLQWLFQRCPRTPATASLWKWSSHSAKHLHGHFDLWAVCTAEGIIVSVWQMRKLNLTVIGFQRWKGPQRPFLSSRFPRKADCPVDPQGVNPGLGPGLGHLLLLTNFQSIITVLSPERNLRCVCFLGRFYRN